MLSLKLPFIINFPCLFWGLLGHVCAGWLLVGGSVLSSPRLFDKQEVLCHWSLIGILCEGYWSYSTPRLPGNEDRFCLVLVCYSSASLASLGWICVLEPQDCSLWQWVFWAREVRVCSFMCTYRILAVWSMPMSDPYFGFDCLERRVAID